MNRGSVRNIFDIERWDADGIDVAEWQAKYKSEDLPVCPVEVIATPEDNAMGEKYFVERRDELVRVMGINLDWRLNECSDGQRKEVLLRSLSILQMFPSGGFISWRR